MRVGPIRMSLFAGGAVCGTAADRFIRHVGATRHSRDADCEAPTALHATGRRFSNTLTDQNQSSEQSPAFVQHLIDCQGALLGYLLTLLGGAPEARDVLQETNLALWHKATDYNPEQPFLPWACAFARYQAMAWRKRQSRCRLLINDRLLEEVAEELPAADQLAERRWEIMEDCIRTLPVAWQYLLECRYVRGESVNSIAARLGRSENVVAASLYRIRKILNKRVHQVLAVEPECAAATTTAIDRPNSRT